MKLKRRKSRTLRERLLIPLCIVLLLQASIFSGLFLNVIVLPEIENYTYDMLREQVANGAQNIQYEMNVRWADLDNALISIIEKADQLVLANNGSYADIQTNYLLNEGIISAAAEDLESLLWQNSVTGAFIVIDGMACDLSIHSTSKPGLYIRDLDSSLPNTPDKSRVLLMERGLLSLSREKNYSLDSFWAAHFDFTYDDKGSQGEIPREEQFFFEPVLAARSSRSTEYQYFGYWSKMFLLGEYDSPVLTYSIPLIADDGTVFGVMGVEVSEQQLRKLMLPTQLKGNGQNAYVLALQEGAGNFEVVCFNGQGYQSRLSNGDIIQGSETEREGIYRFALGKDRYIAGKKALSVYDMRSSFADQKWVLIGMVPQDSFLAFPNYVQVMTVIMTVAMLLLGGLGVVFMSNAVLKPISTVIEDLHLVNPEDRVVLRKTYIQEIDVLTSSIEEMSQSVAESASKVSTILDMTGVPIGVYEYQKDGRVFCSNGFFKMLRIGSANYPGGYMSHEAFAMLLDSLRKQSYEGEEEGILCIPLDGSDTEKRLWMRLTEFTQGNQVLGTIIDISHEMEEKLRIEYERDYDSLTGILNRRAFYSRSGSLFTNHKDRLKVAALLMCDMDNLKYINDTYGHDVGDAYIRLMASTLKVFEDDRCLVARRSGDEFVALIYGYDTREEVRKIIARIEADIAGRFIKLPNGNSYTLRASGGVAWYPQDASSLEELIHYADFAMYRVKHSNKGAIWEFNLPEYEINAYLVNGQEALNRLLENGEFTFALQPIISVANSNVYGYEFLLRSTLPEFTSPLDIIRMAASQSKLLHLESAIWAKALATFKERVERGQLKAEHHAFINSIGSVAIAESEYRQLLDQYREYFPQVVLELTEGERMEEESNLLKRKFMREAKMQFAIDDYGTGYNSQYALLSFHPEIIKVDISIIRDVDTNFSKQMILKDTIAYARTQGIRVLAEGVETKGEMEMVIALGVDYLQGYYLGRPEYQPMQIPEKILGEIGWAKKNAKTGFGIKD